MARLSLPLGGALPEECQEGAITVGNFDGVHLGHQALLAELARQAGSLPGPAVVVTFSPHPMLLLKPELFQPELTNLDQRVALLSRHGAGHVVVLETTPDLLHLSAREFFEQIIIGRLRAKVIVEGFNFGFGRNREGTVATMQSLGREHSVKVVLVPALEMLGKPVSSSRVRNELVAGNVGLARELLGRCFSLSGRVTRGQARGKSLGFPTANLADVATLVPGDGVYAVRARVQDKTWPGAANIGTNPTFGEQSRKIEVHLIDFAGDLYGETLTVEFVEKLRDTRAFAGPKELQAQLQADVDRARRINEGTRTRV